MNSTISFRELSGEIFGHLDKATLPDGKPSSLVELGYSEHTEIVDLSLAVFSENIGQCIDRTPQFIANAANQMFDRSKEIATLTSLQRQDIASLTIAVLDRHVGERIVDDPEFSAEAGKRLFKRRPK